MLTGIQITFMVFCWVVIFGCICSVIYSVVDLMRARHEERKKRKDISQEQIAEIVAMVEKERNKQRDDNLRSDSRGNILESSNSNRNTGNNS